MSNLNSHQIFSLCDANCYFTEPLNTQIHKKCLSHHSIQINLEYCSIVLPYVIPLETDNNFTIEECYLDTIQSMWRVKSSIEN